MLSKYDIISELGKGINIFPFNEDNLKDNSYNLTASKYAWSNKSAKLRENNGNFICEELGKRYKKDDREILIEKGKNCVRTINGKDYIILLPFSTTLIITEEVLGIGSYIGGTYHSKVGLVSIGLGHIGTMLGPNFCGHSLVAIHNVSEDIIKLDVKETFVSVVFHRLDTNNFDHNTTVSGHTDKYAKFGILEHPSELDQDWKRKIDDISYKMKNSDDYKKYKKKHRYMKFKELRSNLSWKNFTIFMLPFLLFFVAYKVAVIGDSKLKSLNETPKYVSYLFNVGLSGVGIFIFQFILSFLKPKR